MLSKKSIFVIVVMAVCWQWFESCPLSFAEEHIIITSEEVRATTDELKEGIKRVMDQIQIRELNYESAEAKAWIEKLQIESIPYIIFDKGIEKSNKFFELARAGMIERRNGEYVIPDLKLPAEVMFFKRERRPHQLDIFVMSYCPPGNDALRQIDNYLKAHSSAFKVTCHYIATFRDFGIDSLHGPPEIREDIRQLLIQKYYPDKIWEYLKMHRQGRNFEDACKELGIAPSEIEKRWKRGRTLLKDDFAFVNQLGIKSSPTFLWENQILFVSVDSFKRFLSRLDNEQGEKKQLKTSLFTGAKDVIPIAVFYRAGCGDCDWLLDAYIPKLEREFSKHLAFEYYDVSLQENFEKKLRVEEEAGVMGGGIPQVFVAGRLLSGRNEIENKLGDILKKIIAEGTYKAGQKAVLTDTDTKGSRRLVERFKSFTPLAIIGAGLLDGINPCAFSTIVFFLSFLSLMGFNLRQMVLVGISFTLAVFLTYLGLGLGIFVGLERLKMFTSFSKYFDAAVGGIAIILGTGSLYDYIYFKKKGVSEGMLLQLPRSTKNTIHKSIRVIRDKKNTGLLKLLSVAFCTGVLVSLLESVCTGQVYLPILTFILKMKLMWWMAFLFLLLYNAMFILPQVIVFSLTLYGVSSQWWARLTQHSLGKVKLATAVFFFCMGIFIILW